MSTFTLGTPLTALGPDAFEHEQVVVCQDPTSGLKAVIAIHSTALGPALGGARFRAYRSDEEAVRDVLKLSRGMSYKNAMAGLDFGGGKAVIVGNPDRDKTEELLLAFGRSVAALGGRYITGSDVGTGVRDMEVVSRVCPWTACLSRELDQDGDTAGFTAHGVLHGMRAAARYRWGTASLRGRTIGVAGVGKVGRVLVDLLFREGAKVVVTDVLDEPVRRIVEEFPETVVVEDTDALVRFGGMDVYAPCALGGALTEAVVPVLTAEVVCGAANNQLAHPDVEQQLADRGVLYLPDYVVNAGGAILGAGEVLGQSLSQSAANVERIFDTTLEVLRRAEAEGILPGTAAERIARQRIDAAAEKRAEERALQPGGRVADRVPPHDDPGDRWARPVTDRSGSREVDA
ncbi:valine dehydrogenase (NAD+) [Saccharothrix tamanrassetensis]|uniref:Valine dehydrogenase (NAD+) n=1 Tax=Saccharothrix tamanrassetensis TaxID=1051531 RepID=A0A841CCN3_9PSEU|nr:Glu/Leu/Phe/Val dehydrogenase [Saccharothrix tamanrassetensis]MBB5953937.1 valine dehydrogenase (NAD+) [Saccharothrix tamanrassetensis]